MTTSAGGDSSHSVLKDAVKASPKETAPFLALSSIYLRHLHKPDLAAKYAQKAIEISPKMFAPYEALWEVYLSEAKPLPSKCSRRLRAQKSLDPNFWLSLAELSSRVLPGCEDSPSWQAELQRVGRLLDKAAACGEKIRQRSARSAIFMFSPVKRTKLCPFYKKVVELRPSYPQTMKNCTSH